MGSSELVCRECGRPIVSGAMFCAFCGRRHIVDVDDLEAWSVVCPCGARGFVEDDPPEQISEEGKSVSSEITTACAGFSYRFDAKPLHIDEQFRKWFVCWCRVK